MAETRRKFDQDFKEGAVRLVCGTGRPVAQVGEGRVSGLSVTSLGIAWPASVFMLPISEGLAYVRQC